MSNRNIWNEVKKHLNNKSLMLVTKENTQRAIETRKRKSDLFAHKEVHRIFNKISQKMGRKELLWNSVGQRVINRLHKNISALHYKQLWFKGARSLTFGLIFLFRIGFLGDENLSKKNYVRYFGITKKAAAKLIAEHAEIRRILRDVENIHQVYIDEHIYLVHNNGIFLSSSDGEYNTNNSNNNFYN